MRDAILSDRSKDRLDPISDSDEACIEFAKSLQFETGGCRTSPSQRLSGSFHDIRQLIVEPSQFRRVSRRQLRIARPKVQRSIRPRILVQGCPRC
jgi:hypothetical protein